MQEEKKIKVSVCVITHNQEKFISQCLQSIVDQKTNFNFEVIVGDDCSTDGTRAVIKEFVMKYPHMIKPVRHEENIGVCKNIICVYEKAIGEYIAHIDGDDFMLPGKLSIQAGELDKNPDCAMCVHAVKRFDQQNQQYRRSIPKNIPKKSDLSFLLMNLPFFAHSSKMFRAECGKGLDLPADGFLDCYLHIHHAMKGKILYLNDFLGVYRIGVGVSRDINSDNYDNSMFENKIIKLAMDAIEYAGRNGIGQDIINKSKAKVYLRYSYRYLMKKDFERFKTLLSKSVETARLGNIQFIFKCFSGAPYLLAQLARLIALLEV